MNLFRSFLLLLASLTVASFILIGGLIFIISDDMCGNTIYNEIYSPNMLKKAVLFQRDCGATTGFSTQISIIHADTKLDNKSGNIYVKKGHPDDVAPTIKWFNDTHLHIYESKDRHSIELFDTVKITYKSLGDI